MLLLGLKNISLIKIKLIHSNIYQRTKSILNPKIIQQHKNTTEIILSLFKNDFIDKIENFAQVQV